MKNLKRIAAVVLLAAMMMTFCGAALASVPVITTGKCNLRKGPSTNYSSMKTIQKDTVLEVYDRDYDWRGVAWYQVKYEGTYGWISSVYAKKVTDPKPHTDKIVGATGDSYIRAKANKDSKQLGVLPEGKSANYLGQKKRDSRGVYWYKVTYKGITGWVSSKYTKLR